MFWLPSCVQPAAGYSQLWPRELGISMLMYHQSVNRRCRPLSSYAHWKRLDFSSLAVLSIVSLVLLCALGQTNSTRSLITQPVIETNRITLPGNTHPLARREFDRGAAPLGVSMERMLLVLKRSSEQESAPRKVLDEQLNRASPNFHKWLTPEQFGRQFGASDEDIRSVTSWLESHGLRVARVSKGRHLI